MSPRTCVVEAGTLLCGGGDVVEKSTTPKKLEKIVDFLTTPHFHFIKY
jgi:hypothetical protein